MKLLTDGARNPKTAKSTGYGYLTGILHLAPHTQSGYQVCPSATDGCSSACLYFQGRGSMDSVQEARIRKTRTFFENRAEFMADLAKDIASIVRRAQKNNLKPCVRLNGTSDIRWERTGIMEQFPNVTFYDYTKIKNRKRLPKNYSLTFSRSEATTNDEWRQAIDDGMNVAVVFRNTLPERWHFNWEESVPVIDGTTHDLRFLDPKPCIVGLTAKGSAKKDTSGFVV